MKALLGDADLNVRIATVLGLVVVADLVVFCVLALMGHIVVELLAPVGTAVGGFLGVLNGSHRTDAGGAGSDGVGAAALKE